MTAAALAPGSVTGPALAPGAVAGSNLAETAVSWKALGGQIVAATPIALPVATTDVVPVTATASCPPGTVAISGGKLISDPVFAYVIQSLPAALPGGAATGWTATGTTVGSLPATMTVYAICINAGT